MLKSHTLIILLVSHLGLATIYSIAIGTFGNNLYTATFDSQTFTLKKVNSYSYSSKVGNWVIANSQGSVLYGPSYALSISGTTLSPLQGTKTPNGIYFQTVSNSTYYTIGQNSVEAWSLSANGGLSNLLSSISFGTTSFSHGVYLSPDNSEVYIPDIDANQIRTFSVSQTGALTPTKAINAPVSNAGPRHLAVHPNGRYIYVLEQGGQTVDVFSTGNSTVPLIYENISLPVLPSGQTKSSFWADEVVISPDSSVIFATNRGRATSSLGYLYAYSLDSSGRPTSTTPLFMTKTPTSGGSANAITLRQEAEGKLWIALTDSSVGAVYMYQFDGKNVTLTAQLPMKEGSCCTNVAWLN